MCEYWCFMNAKLLRQRRPGSEERALMKDGADGQSPMGSPQWRGAGTQVRPRRGRELTGHGAVA